MITMEEAISLVHKYPSIKYCDITGFSFCADEFVITCCDEDVDEENNVIACYYFNTELKDLNNGNRHYYNEFVINENCKIELKENKTINKRKIKTVNNLDEFLADFVSKLKVAKAQCKLSKIKKDFV
jgi:hypothetical protein